MSRLSIPNGWWCVKCSSECPLFTPLKFLGGISNSLDIPAGCLTKFHLFGNYWKYFRVLIENWWLWPAAPGHFHGCLHLLSTIKTAHSIRRIRALHVKSFHGYHFAPCGGFYFSWLFNFNWNLCAGPQRILFTLPPAIYFRSRAHSPKRERVLQIVGNFEISKFTWTIHRAHKKGVILWFTARTFVIYEPQHLKNKAKNQTELKWNKRNREHGKCMQNILWRHFIVLFDLFMCKIWNCCK